MEFIFRYTWVMFIAVTIINGIIFKTRSQRYIADNPDLKDGYDKLIKGWLFYGNIPWVIMAIGDMTGITNGVWNYFHPKSMNPMVLVFHFSIVVIWILGSNWIYLRGGADFLARHPGLIKFHGPGLYKDITSPKTIKMIWALALLGGIAGMTMMWLWDIPTMPGQ
jgi:hypothetical protein